MSVIEKSLSKLANFCGFRVSGERGLNPAAELQKAMKLETKGAAPLADCLLYDYCVDVSLIAFNHLRLKKAFFLSLCKNGVKLWSGSLLSVSS